MQFLGSRLLSNDDIGPSLQKERLRMTTVITRWRRIYFLAGLFGLYPEFGLNIASSSP